MPLPGKVITTANLNDSERIYACREAIGNVPQVVGNWLATALTQIPGVEGVTIRRYSVFIVKAASYEWDEIDERAIALIESPVPDGVLEAAEKFDAMQAGGQPQ